MKGTGFSRPGRGGRRARGTQHKTSTGFSCERHRIRCAFHRKTLCWFCAGYQFLVAQLAAPGAANRALVPSTKTSAGFSWYPPQNFLLLHGACPACGRKISVVCGWNTCGGSVPGISSPGANRSVTMGEPNVCQRSFNLTGPISHVFFLNQI